MNETLFAIMLEAQDFSGEDGQMHTLSILKSYYNSNYSRFRNLVSRASAIEAIDFPEYSSKTVPFPLTSSVSQN